MAASINLFTSAVRGCPFRFFLKSSQTTTTQFGFVVANRSTLISMNARQVHPITELFIVLTLTQLVLNLFFAECEHNNVTSEFVDPYVNNVYGRHITSIMTTRIKRKPRPSYPQIVVSRYKLFQKWILNFQLSTSASELLPTSIIRLLVDERNH